MESKEVLIGLYPNVAYKSTETWNSAWIPQKNISCSVLILIFNKTTDKDRPLLQQIRYRICGKITTLNDFDIETYLKTQTKCLVVVCGSEEHIVNLSRIDTKISKDVDVRVIRTRKERSPQINHHRNYPTVEDYLWGVAGDISEMSLDDFLDHIKLWDAENK